MPMRLIVILGVLHVAACALYGFLCVARVSKHPPAIALLLLFLPVVGFLAALLADVLYARGLDGTWGCAEEHFALEDEIYGRVKQAEETDVVPLVDALTINDAPTRRKIMMEILHRDPEQFIDQLKQTLDVDDTEMIHYSVTTIVEIRTLFEEALMQKERAFRANEGNADRVADYAELIGRCLDSGILEGVRQREIETRYLEVLRIAIRLMPDTPDWRQRFVETACLLRKDAEALEQLRVMLDRWPYDEQVCRAALDYGIRMKDAAWIERISKTTEAYREGWTTATKRAFAFWKGEANGS